MSDPQITREIRPEASLVPPLDPSLLELSDVEWQFLHSAITEDDTELRRRINEVQHDQLYPYPCILMYHFVCLMMRANAVYPSIVKAGKSGNTVFLDIGCQMGTDVRKLVHDGYAPHNVLACDLRADYLTLGHKLFQDAAACSIRFFTSDVFDMPVQGGQAQPLASHTDGDAPPPLAQVTQLAQLRGRVTHVYTGALFHLFDEPTQYAIALRLGVLLKRDTGAVVFGRHQGRVEEGLIPDQMSRIRYGHSPASWTRMWKQVFTELEGADFAEQRVKVVAELKSNTTDAIIMHHSLYWSVSIV